MDGGLFLINPTGFVRSLFFSGAAVNLRIDWHNDNVTYLLLFRLQ